MSEKGLLGEPGRYKSLNREITSCFMEPCPILQLRNNIGNPHYDDMHSAEPWCIVPIVPGWIFIVVSSPADAHVVRTALQNGIVIQKFFRS